MAAIYTGRGESIIGADFERRFIWLDWTAGVPINLDPLR